jgi:rhamnose utilization protein RhaD (predicted bifunctional aldolase and dehydrogenase)/NAD(P)-dependent dehydrogenase (short-subunit alcohol dehydrogenase family)
MENRWSDLDAEAAVERYTKQGISLDVALRTYSTRLLGAEPKLVMHGGGNTSVKTTLHTRFGEDVEVICVKGSGWDMAHIEPAGLPAVRLAPLRRLAESDTLSDEDMVDYQRANLIHPGAPNPSTETLLHAFLPHKYIDHTHANAVLALTNQPRGGESMCRQVYGDTVALVPYVMPGFALAKKALEAFSKGPDVEGMILLNHGIFTFGDTAHQAYNRMIDLVTLAEQRIAQAGRVSVAGVQLPTGMHLPKGLGRYRPKSFQPIRLPTQIATVAAVAPILRGLAALPDGDGEHRRWVLDFRSGPEIEDFVNGQDLPRYSQQGTVTPDHVIRTKPKPLIVPPPDADDLDGFAAAAKKAMATYQSEYRAYFARHNSRYGGGKKELDPAPRVILVPGLGLFGLGAGKEEARVAADLAETNVKVITAAEKIGSYEVIPEADIFDVEYWSLEQAKLGKVRVKPLAGQIALVSGGGSGIGAEIVAALSAEGAEVAVLDIDPVKAETVAKAHGTLALACDVIDARAVERAVARVVEAYGGLDIVVSNAGAAWQGPIGEVDDAVLRQSFDLNFWAHQWLARAAVRVFKAQRTGGCLLFNVSKQSVSPGPEFGPYGIPKAATLALMRQYAVDYGRDRIRSNAVNADRIRSGLLTDPMIAQRAKAHGLSTQEYMAGNLLGLEVTAADVARAFLHLALSAKTTAAVLTVDGGNIAAAPR